MRGQRSGIRGPTEDEKANDRAGNAAVGFRDRGGSGTNQPSRASRNLAPAFSVGGAEASVKAGWCGGQTHRRFVRYAALTTQRKWDNTR